MALKFPLNSPLIDPALYFVFLPVHLKHQMKHVRINLCSLPISPQSPGFPSSQYGIYLWCSLSIHSISQPSSSHWLLPPKDVAYLPRFLTQVSAFPIHCVESYRDFITSPLASTLLPLEIHPPVTWEGICKMQIW